MDLNADLGEGAPHDLALLELVTSASVACGFHAGGPPVMVHTARSAHARAVAIGAHPSYPDREGFGRRDMELSRGEIAAAVAYQVGAMAAAAELAGTRMRFVKPHGALYNRAAVDPGIAEAVVEGVALVRGGTLALLGPAGSELVRRAAAAGLPTYREGFADRAYSTDGSLVERSESGAVIHDPDAVRRQALDLAVRHRVTTRSGETLELEVDSICIHGDNPAALDLARLVRDALEEAGVAVSSFLFD